MYKNKLFAAGKLLLGLTLIVVLIARVDADALFTRLASVKLFYLAIVLVFPHVAIFLSTIKWQFLLADLGIHGRTRRLFAFYLLGTFFNNFLPTTFGGDVMRSYTLCRETRDNSSVIAATFMERFIGMAALVSLLPLVLLQQVVINQFPMLKFLVALVVIFFSATVILVFQQASIFHRLRKRSNKLLGKLLSLIENIHERVFRFRRFKRTLLFSYGMSLAFYIVTAGSTWAATTSVGAEVDYFYLLAILPVVLLAATIPVSLNGLGITEAGYVIFLSLVGVSSVDALAAALLLRGRLLITAVMGGLIFLFYRPEKMSEVSAGVNKGAVEGRSLDDALKNDAKGQEFVAS